MKKYKEKPDYEIKALALDWLYSHVKNLPEDDKDLKLIDERFY